MYVLIITFLYPYEKKISLATFLHKTFFCFIHLNRNNLAWRFLLGFYFLFDDYGKFGECLLYLDALFRAHLIKWNFKFCSQIFALLCTYLSLSIREITLICQNHFTDMFFGIVFNCRDPVLQIMERVPV